MACNGLLAQHLGVAGFGPVPDGYDAFGHAEGEHSPHHAGQHIGHLLARAAFGAALLVGEQFDLIDNIIDALALHFAAACGVSCLRRGGLGALHGVEIRTVLRGVYLRHDNFLGLR